jgi:hypothetical protein
MHYWGADKSLARPTSRCILFDDENISFDASLVTYTGCPGRNVPDFGRMFLKLKYTELSKTLYPKLNGYGDNGERKLWSSCGSMYCTWFA